MQWASYKKSGFTIVELLIVVVVIAILAAITIVAYNGIQNRAKNSASSLVASQAAKKLAIYATSNGESFPEDKATFLSRTGLSESGDTVYQYSSASPYTAYCLTTTKGSVSYFVTNSNSTPSAGACPGHGLNGALAVTNLAHDPRATSLSLPAGRLGWNAGRWAGSGSSSATHTLITGASDGPVSGVSTYVRKQWTVTPASIANTGDTGFNLSMGGASSYPVTAGQVLNISCYLRPSVNRNLEIGIYQYAPGGATFSTARIYAGAAFGPANQWTRLSYAYTVPSGVALIAPICDSNASASGGAVSWTVGSTLDGTGFMMTEGSSLYSYGDGATAGWIWNGNANASTSTGTGTPI